MPALDYATLSANMAELMGWREGIEYIIVTHGHEGQFRTVYLLNKNGEADIIWSPPTEIEQAMTVAEKVFPTYELSKESTNDYLFIADLPKSIFQFTSRASKPELAICLAAQKVKGGSCG